MQEESHPAPEHGKDDADTLQSIRNEIKQGTTEPAENPFRKQRAKRQRMQTIIGGLIASVAVVGSSFFVYLESRGGIMVLDPKSDTTITLNNRIYTGHADSRGIYIPTNPGVYRLRITRPNFTPFVNDIKIHRGEVVNVRPIFNLMPQVSGQENSTVDFIRTTTDQKSVLYLGNNRQAIYRLQIADQRQFPITNTPLLGVRDIQWAEQADVALVLKADGLYLQEIPKYDFRTQTAEKIAGNEVSAAIWDPSTFERIAIVYNPPSGEHSLVFTDKRITQLDRKADIRNLTNPRLVWSKDINKILLIPRDSNRAKNDLWEYNTTNGQLMQLTHSGSIENASFSPDSSTILYQTGVDSAAKLMTMHADGTSQQDLSLTGTVSNAAWKDSASFYIPSPDRATLNLFTLSSKSSQSVPFSFPNNQMVRGTEYLVPTHTLIFYTNSTIYLSNLEL
jgi:WD40 repeat protein